MWKITFSTYFVKKVSETSHNLVASSLRKQPSVFAPGPSGVSREGRERRRTAVFAGYVEEGRLFSQATLPVPFPWLGKRHWERS